MLSKTPDWNRHKRRMYKKRSMRSTCKGLKMKKCRKNKTCRKASGKKRTFCRKRKNTRRRMRRSKKHRKH